MRESRAKGRTFCTIPALLLLAACSTPAPVREMSEKTAANVTFVSVQLKQLEHESREVAALRAANIARLHRVNEEFRAEYEFDKALTEKSGDRNSLQELEAWSNRVKQFHKDLDKIEQEKQLQIEALRVGLADRATELAAVAENLAALAEDDSLKDRAIFLAGYFSEVRDAVDTRLKKNDETAKRAKAALDALSGKLATPMKEPSDGGS